MCTAELDNQIYEPPLRQWTLKMVSFKPQSYCHLLMQSYSRICREPLDSEINAIEERLRKTLRGISLLAIHTGIYVVGNMSFQFTHTSVYVRHTVTLLLARFLICITYVRPISTAR